MKTEISNNAGILLSICIPVYNGAAFIGTVLDALLPQVRSAGGQVEVILADDGSSDDTTAVVTERPDFADFRYFRNDPNLGMSPNIVRCLTEHARGTYVWIWSQHCVFHPGALGRITAAIERNYSLDGFYVNFNCANYPEDWPNSRDATVSPKYSYRSTEDTSERIIATWQELLKPESAYCTQTYAHILRTALARAYWKDRTVGREFTNARDTFAQCCTVAESLFNKPAYYIGSPVFTIYNGAQTWSSLEQRSRVYLMAFPEVIRIYETHGFQGANLTVAQQYAVTRALGVMKEMFESPQNINWSRIIRYLARYGSYPGSLSGCMNELFSSEYNWLTRFLSRAVRLWKRVFRYCFFDCRPARWYHQFVYRRSQ